MKVDHHPTKGNKKGYNERQGETMRDKGRQDPGEGGHTIQQRETRMGTCWEKRGDKTPREGGPPSNKGK